MRIAIFHNLPSGGAKRALHDFTRSLRERGHYLDLYTLDTADERYCPLAPFVGTVRMFACPPRPSFSHRAPLLSGYILLFQHLRFLSRMDRLSRAIADEIAQGGYDLAFVHPCRFFKVPPLLSHLRIPSVFFAQEHHRELFEVAPRAGREGVLPCARQLVNLWYLPVRILRRRALRRANRKGMHAATLLLANSSYQAGILRALYGISARVVHLGVDTALFHPLPDIARKNMVLSVGMLSPYKGHDFVVDALARIAPRIRPELVVVANAGGDLTRRLLVRKAAEAGVRVRIATLVTDEELIRLYNSAMLLCCAQVREPFGLVAIEAMACGTPVVGVREGGIPESVAHGATGILTGRHASDFAKAIEQLLQDQALWNRLSAGGLAAARGYWNREAACDRLMAALTARGRAPEA